MIFNYFINLNNVNNCMNICIKQQQIYKLTDIVIIIDNNMRIHTIFFIKYNYKYINNIVVFIIKYGNTRIIL